LPREGWLSTRSGVNRGAKMQTRQPVTQLSDVLVHAGTPRRWPMLHFTEAQVLRPQEASQRWQGVANTVTIGEIGTCQQPIAEGSIPHPGNDRGKSGVDATTDSEIGNRFSQAGITRPVVYHNTPPNLITQWLRDTGVKWRIVQRIEDEAAAAKRIREFMAEAVPTTRSGITASTSAFYIATGERKSPQVRARRRLRWIERRCCLLGSNSKS